MSVKKIFEMDLRGKEYVRAFGLSPEIVKDRQHHCKDCAMRDREPDVVRMINSWRDEELRFVGAI